MRTIIAPTDFSTASLNAVNYAADLALALKAELILLHVIPIPVTVAEIPLTEYDYDDMLAEAEQEMVVLKNQLFIRTQSKINIHSKMTMGSVDHELEEECAYKRPFAVVMATKGGSAAKTFLVGSNTIYAVRNLPYPVLVVPQHVLFKPITKITLASDLKEFAGVKVIKCLREWLHEFKSSLDIINVVDDSQLEADALPESISLQNLLGDFRPRFHFLEATGLEEGIYRFIEENRSDLLVVIPRRHGLFEILLHKSASKPFILHPHIPVLAIAE